MISMTPTVKYAVRMQYVEGGPWFDHISVSDQTEAIRMMEDLATRCKGRVLCWQVVQITTQQTFKVVATS